MNVVIISENKKDLMKAMVHNMAPSLQDRLTLNLPRIEAMAEGLRQVANLPDPLGQVLTSTTRPNGLKIEKISVP
ncbi:MAG: gamma-glutamyl-phosphate reductase, partial [Clostridiales bacterium]|nr:gamma-glutamyl-phosphate reductase [Clostridiales bacterium]